MTIIYCIIVFYLPELWSIFPSVHFLFKQYFCNRDLLHCTTSDISWQNLIFGWAVVPSIAAIKIWHLQTRLYDFRENRYWLRVMATVLSCDDQTNVTAPYLYRGRREMCGRIRVKLKSVFMCKTNAKIEFAEDITLGNYGTGTLRNCRAVLYVRQRWRPTDRDVLSAYPCRVFAVVYSTIQWRIYGGGMLSGLQPPPKWFKKLKNYFKHLLYLNGALCFFRNNFIKKKKKKIEKWFQPGCINFIQLYFNSSLKCFKVHNLWFKAYYQELIINNK
jgi:hypothetical protein